MYELNPSDHFHIWQVLPQLCYSNTCQILTLYSTGDYVLIILTNGENNEMEETVWVTPTTDAWLAISWSSPWADNVSKLGQSHLKAPLGRSFILTNKSIHWCLHASQGLTELIPSFSLKVLSQCGTVQNPVNILKKSISEYSTQLKLIYRISHSNK